MDRDERDIGLEQDLATMNPNGGTTRKSDLCRVRGARVGRKTGGANARDKALVHREHKRPHAT